MSASMRGSKSRKPSPIADMQPAIVRLREIAAQSGTALFTEGPVHPDHEQLEICAHALHHLGHAQKAYDARPEYLHLAHQSEQNAAVRARREELYEDFKEGERLGKSVLNKITKLRATTAAGIYAKAMIVRTSKTGAAGLAMSLAQDLLDCPGLRSSLWPAQTEGEP
jgi:hypothetical protein